jgi:hypothetical protein
VIEVYNLQAHLPTYDSVNHNRALRFERIKGGIVVFILSEVDIVKI